VVSKLSFTLYLNKDKWYAQQQKLTESYPDYLPVIKGNGYGFGNRYLGQACLELGKQRIATGTLEEARSLLSAGLQFEEIVVLTPVLSEFRVEDFAQCVFTVGSLLQLEHLLKTALGLIALGQQLESIRILLKCQSSMRRYGFSQRELVEASERLSKVSGQLNLEIRGYAIHFPIDGLGDTEKLTQLTDWVECIAKLGLGGENFYLSHVSSELCAKLNSSYPKINFSLRMGTALWLNSAYSFRSTVLAVQEIRRGQSFGYKQKKAKREGYLLYVAGGSANGVGLEAPLHMKSLKDRLKLTAFWLLNLFNLNLSPFIYQGKRLWFAEPPHMQTTVLRLPTGLKPPAVGTEIELKNLRMTLANFDRVVEITPENQATRIYQRTEA
jgi:alanine racemase